MTNGNIVTASILLVLGLIIFILFKSLYYLLTGKGGSKSTVITLSFRIGLSIFLFLILIGAIWTGLIIPSPVLL